jgi:branched-chain amino acid transport system permease protein
MTLLLQYVVNGLASGSLYALVALGIVLLYRCSRVLNFAHGDLSSVGVFLALSALTAGWPYPLALAAGLGGAGVLAVSFYRVFLRPVRGGTVLGSVIATLAFALVLSGVQVWVWGTQTRVFPFPLSESRVVRWGGVAVSERTVGTLGIGMLLVAGLSVFVRKSRWGLAMRAVAQDPEAAQMVGVPAGRVLAATWALSGVLGASAGVLLAPAVFVDPFMMLDPFLKGFTAAVLGGIESLPGAVVGGFGLGVLESLFAGYVSVRFKTTLAFGVIVAALLVRPEGLLGRPLQRRV